MGSSATELLRDCEDSDQYVSQYRIEPSRIRSRPASNSAFSSAWMHKQVERPTPAADPELHRRPAAIRNSPQAGIGILTSAFIAVLEVSRRTIVACTNHPLLSHQDTADPPFHTITPTSSQRCKLHEVLVPIRPQTLIVGKVQIFEGALQSLHRRCLIDQTDLCAVNQASQSDVTVIKMRIIAKNKVIERW